MKVSEAMRQAVLNELRSKGGKARAQKYDKKTLSKWAKRGGRPRKDAQGQGEKGSAPAREKGRRK